MIHRGDFDGADRDCRRFAPGRSTCKAGDAGDFGTQGWVDGAVKLGTRLPSATVWAHGAGRVVHELGAMAVAASWMGSHGNFSSSGRRGGVGLG